MTTLPLNTMEVLKKRYLLKDECRNVIESPDDLFRRVAENIAKAEDAYPSRRGRNLKVCLGIMFAAHGLQMAFGLFKGPGVAGFSKMLPPMLGVPSMVWLYITSYTCLIGGACLIIGLCTRIAVISLIIFMITAVALVHWKNGFYNHQYNREYINR